MDQPQRKLYFQPISILVPSFLSQYPPIRSRLRMSLLPDVSPGAKPLDQHPPTFLSFSQSLNSIIGTAGTLVVVTVPSIRPIKLQYKAPKAQYVLQLPPPSAAYAIKIWKLFCIWYNKDRFYADIL